MKTHIRIILGLLAVAMLAACGAKGPLFLPREQAPTEVTEEAGDAAVSEAEPGPQAPAGDGQR